MTDSTSARFATLTAAYFDDQFARHPSYATNVGRHEHDARLEDLSPEIAADEAAAVRAFRTALEALDPRGLTRDEAADRTWLLAVTDGQLQYLEDLKPFLHDPDVYSSGITSSAFSLINRDFAPASERLESLLSRMKDMPGFLLRARQHLSQPSRVHTVIALDQLEGNRAFFRETVPEAFATVADSRLQARLLDACRAVDEALDAYGKFLAAELLPKATDRFAIGPEAFRRKLRADELIDMSLEHLLELGERDLQRSQAAMREAAAAIDPTASLDEVLARLGSTHVAPEALLDTTRGTLDRIIDFIKDRDLVTMPPGPPLHVVETPPFLRATITAAMDSPGPFETRGTDAYYYITLPNPAWPAEEQEAYMQQWTRPLITNLSVHEAFPGHYIQFLYLPGFPGLARKVMYSPSNAEGWAHYCEHLMIEEGFCSDDPWYRVAQLQDALLRNARLVVGLQMHTAHMGIEEAIAFFEREAYLAHPVAKSEAWRGATDPTYGYYTLGKLLLLQLREDVKRERGEAFSLKAFHDEFLRMGPLPIPLVRELMLGS